MQIGFIGTGRIARRLVRGLEGPDHAITVTRRSEGVSRELADADARVAVVATAQEVVDRSDVVFVCLAVEVARTVLPTLAFSQRHTVVSVMAGMSLAALQHAVAPANDLCITIPMPFVEQGDCPLPVYPRSGTFEALYGRRNPVIPVEDEAALEPFWVVAGTMASVIAELQTITAWLGERVGDAAAAERYVTGLYGGCFASLAGDGEGRLDAALADLSIEGGLNASLHEHIDRSGHYDDLRRGLDRLYRRLNVPG